MLDVIFFYLGCSGRCHPLFQVQQGIFFQLKLNQQIMCPTKKGLIIGSPDVWHFERLEKKLKENIYVH